MKVFVAILSAALFANLSAQVTYGTTGTTVAKVVAELARSTDHKLAVDKELANEIVVVSVRDISLDEFKKRLADCVSGKWVEKEDGVVELRVDSTVAITRRKAAQKAYAQRIPSQIESSKKTYSQPGIGAIHQDSAKVNHFALEVGERISESDYEKLLPNGRIVFSTDPNRSQAPLPDISDLIAKYIDLRIATFITEFIFAVERPTSGEFTRFGLYGLDRRGTALSFVYLSLGSIEASRPLEKGGSPIKWSPASQELAKLFRTWDYRADRGLLVIPPFLREMLSKPTQVDPISFGFGEGILACADEASENVIACIADDDLDGIFSMGIPGTTTGEFWNKVERRKTMTASRSNGWIIVRPADPTAARERRGDRVALEKLIGKAANHVWAPLEDISEFAASNLNCKRLPSAFVLPYQVLINNYGSPQKAYDSDFRPLQLYACLTPSERQKLRNGDALSAASMSAKAKQVLNAVFFEPGGAVLVFSISGEPTEIFPLGVNDSLRLTAKVTKSVVLAPLPDAGEPTMPAAPMSARDLAQSRWSRKYDDNPYAQNIPEVTRVRIGSRLEWNISLMLQGNQIGSLALADDSASKESKPVTMEALPQNVNDVLEKAYQDYLKEMAGGG